MKKIITMLLCFTTLLLLTGCSKKTALTPDDFVTKLEAEGYAVHNIIEQYDAETVKAVFIAQKEDHQIEFYQASSENEAVAIFNNQKKEIESYKGNSSKEGSVSLGNYSSYNLTSGEEYYIVSRIEDTIIYSNVQTDLQQDVKDIIKIIGY